MKSVICTRVMTFVGVLVLTVGCAQAQPGAESPEAVIAAAQKAGEARDSAGIVALIAPSTLPANTFGLEFGFSMMSRFASNEAAKQAAKDAADELAALREQYGVPPVPAEGLMSTLKREPGTSRQDAMTAAAGERYAGMSREELRSYMTDLAGLMFSVAPKMMPPDKEMEAMFPAEEAGEIKVEGDRATVQIGNETVAMLLEGGRWYLAKLPG